MAGRGHDLPPLRASDAERDRALRALRDASVEGRLSHETFVRRVDDVLRTRTRDELAELVIDLPGRFALTDSVLRLVSGASLRTTRRRRAWRAPRLPRLWLPAVPGGSYTVGRAPDCDLVLDHPTVSRYHARLRRDPDGWVLVDAASTNGTRVNGWRVEGAQQVRHGDRVSFGALTLLLAERPGGAVSV
jgi:FHA domain-containing protein/uncharacterized protein DUF1707